MQEASMKLTESLHEVYEPDWYGREDVKMVGEVRARITDHAAKSCSLTLALDPLLPLHSLNREEGGTMYPEDTVQSCH